jgi:monofunctional glycosyltransferase
MPRRSKPRARWGLRLAAVLLLVLAAWMVWEAVTWPSVARLAREGPASTAFIDEYRAGLRAQGKPDRVAWTWTPYAAISADLKRAVLVAEDINFFSHGGFDFGAVRTAITEAVRDREAPRGASTITQQLAKNLWLSPSRNPWRKIKEAVLTWQLEGALSKRRILELYLNVVEFGPGVYGAGAASQRYFGRAADSLTPAEAAALAAGLPMPRVWHPGVATPAYRRRVAAILRQMERATFLARQI